MIDITPTLRLNDDDILLTATRSRGPGGQNVNKVSSAAVLSFDLGDGSPLPPDIRAVVRHRLSSRLTKDGRLLLRCDTARDLESNRREVIRRFVSLLQAALTPRKKRKPTKPTRGSRLRRLKDKSLRSARKQDRRGGNPMD